MMPSKYLMKKQKLQMQIKRINPVRLKQKKSWIVMKMQQAV